jgi:hypothetical protein
MSPACRAACRPGNRRWRSVAKAPARIRSSPIGITSQTGRHGGTYDHKDIAFEFASWVAGQRTSQDVVWFGANRLPVDPLLLLEL